MNKASATIRPSDVVRAITEHPRRLAICIASLTFLALLYALLWPATWEVTQALVVRDEAGDRLSRPGKFAHSDEMKASQETILELVKSRGVLTKALAEVGPPSSGHASSDWPTQQDVDTLQGCVKVTPPKGAEFGKTEVFYLKVRDSSRQRAANLALAICHQLQTRFAELREAKAHSTVGELTKAAELANSDLATATKALGTIEQQVSSDLVELRILNEHPSGDSDLRRTATDLERELRSYRATQTEHEELLKLLKTAANDPDRLMASPGVLLKTQPGLGRLKDGLVDAQLRTGQLLGTMGEEHPMVRGARAAEEAIHHQLHSEISVAIRGLEVDLRVNADRIKALEEQEAALNARFARLAGVRAEYANLVTATKNRSETLRTVEHELAEARASQAAAGAAGLISLVDGPDGGTQPLGPSKAMILFGGMFGGLLVAVAIAFVTVMPEPIAQRARRYASVAAGPAVSWKVAPTLKKAFDSVSKYRVLSP
jgi:uncharacterized protein involved in exopolysaccharide biosynthesis